MFQIRKTNTILFYVHFLTPHVEVKTGIANVPHKILRLVKQLRTRQEVIFVLFQHYVTEMEIPQAVCHKTIAQVFDLLVDYKMCRSPSLLVQCEHRTDSPLVHREHLSKAV